MKAEFRLLTKLLPVDKRQLTDRQMYGSEIRRTSKWETCIECGTTYPHDEDPVCDCD